MKVEFSESSTVEFKQQAPDVQKLLKEVVAMCNHLGGTLYIGIADDGEVTGLESNEINRLLEFLPKAIYETTTPPINVHAFPAELLGKQILQIQIPEGMFKPHYVTSLGLHGGTFLRVGRSSMVAKSESILLLQWVGRGHSPDELPIQTAEVSDLSTIKIEHFFKKKHRKPSTGKITESHLLSYKIITEVGAKKYRPTTAGLLLFGNEPQKFISEAYAFCSQVNGIKGREATAGIEIKGDLFEQYEQALGFIESRLPFAFSITGYQRKNRELVPRLACREALINLIAHRDYTLHSISKITIFSNRIEFFSPGLFPGILSQENYLQGLSFFRNRITSRILFEGGLIEKMGSGFKTMFDEYKKYSKSIRPQVVEGDGFVLVTLPFITDEPNNIAEIVLPVKLKNKKTLRVADIMTAMGVSRVTASRYLSNLVKHGLFLREGRGPKTIYVKIKPKS